MKNTLKKIVGTLRVRHAQNGSPRRARVLTSTPFASTALLLALAFGLAPHIASAAQLASLGGYGAGMF